ncbi:hypothetical protein [Priestia aryabhattai]|uniref:hypothetical protein n=1 Tax=Priestia aryabhattai TaxID=412384 RepID=UPI002E1CE1A5|nr:hypothetical protein [Priestia aryabhattai]
MIFEEETIFKFFLLNHTANSKSVGACFSFGNKSPSGAHMLNNNCGPGISAIKAKLITLQTLKSQ